MTTLELVIWSMALGAIAAVALARIAYGMMRPSLSQARGVGYHAAVFLLVLVECGVAGKALGASHEEALRIAQVLAGPLCVALANLWIQRWLSAHQRDRFMVLALRASSVLLPAAALAALALPGEQHLPVAAALALAGSTLTVWMNVRAALLGDRLAPVMAAGCLLTLPAIGGMYALAMDLAEPGALAQAAVALCAAGSNALTGFALWRREREEWEARALGAGAVSFDPVTRMPTGTGFVLRLLHAQKRRKRTRRPGAMLAVMIFEVERLRQQVGTAGVNELMVVLANRIQRQVGVVNLVGRYWERSFVSLIESVQSPGWLRTLGLRVAASARRPIDVTAADGARMQVRPDIAVGIVQVFSHATPVEDILHDAECMAEAARSMPSRAAIMDRRIAEAVPVELADLGPRYDRRGRRDRPGPNRRRAAGQREAAEALR
jgi:GGDEF domain-containing protein